MFDSHCHLHDRRVEDVVKLLDEARAAGLRRLLLAGVDEAGWQDQAALVAAHPELWSSYGLHPQLVQLLDDAAVAAQLDALDRRLAARAPAERVVAVGEIGLDLVDERRASLDRQIEVFAAQLGLAQRHRLPVCLHILRAHGEALRVLRQIGLPAEGGVVHSYSGSPELVRDYVELGLHLSFAGSVTWHGASRAQRAVKATPAERLLVETDTPDQTPGPHRPGPNRPAFLVAILKVVAQIRGEELQVVARLTDDNACRLFGITP